MSNLNETFFRLFHGLLDLFPWLEPLIAFGTKPLGAGPLAALDSLVIAAAFLTLFLYYDGVPGFLNVSKFTWRKIAVISLTGVIALSVASLAKDLFLVARPYVQLHDIQPLFQLGMYDSFPSGHATFFAALAVAVWHYHHRLGFLYMLAAVVIGISRIVAGVHFPVDIIAGLALGGGGAWIMMKVFFSLKGKGLVR